jgi:hypothetical protein
MQFTSGYSLTSGKSSPTLQLDSLSSGSVSIQNKNRATCLTDRMWGKKDTEGESDSLRFLIHKSLRVTTEVTGMDKLLKCYLALQYVSNNAVLLKIYLGSMPPYLSSSDKSFNNVTICCFIAILDDGGYGLCRQEYSKD